MTTELTVWKDPKFEGTSLIPTPESVGYLMNPQVLVGRENVDQDDLLVPSFSLLQGMSEAVTSGVPGAQQGKFQHSNTGEIFEGPLKCIVVHYHKSNAFFPQTDKYPEAAGKETCISPDAKVGNVYGVCEECGICLNWMDDGRPPMGSRNHVFTILTKDGPAFLRYGRTSFKAAKKFISNWNFSSKNLWTHPCEVTVKSDQKQLQTGKKATYYLMDLQWMTEEVTPPEWQKVCEAMHNRIDGAHESGALVDEAGLNVGEFD